MLEEAVKLNVNGTLTVTIWGPVVPPGPVAVSENVVIAVSGVTDEPEVGSPLESSGIGTAGVIVTAVALVVTQVRVVVWPPPTVVGLAVNWVICGGVGGGGGVTCTVTVCGELLPPTPVATAEYVVFWVGESLTLPEACGLVLNVRVDDPAVAVIVTPVAFVLCQFSVTLCPEVMEVGLALSVTVGDAGVGGGDLAAPLEQPINPVNVRDTTPTPMKRKGVLLILLLCGSDALRARTFQMPRPLCGVAAKPQVRWTV